MEFDYELLANIVSGPVAALFICLLIMYKGYKLIVEQMLPQQRQSLEDVLVEHRKDRKVFFDSILVIDNRLDNVDSKLGFIKHTIENINTRQMMDDRLKKSLKDSKTDG